MDERPASADIGLTDSEQRLLDHIRAGLVDAEIAVRLGITNAEVKSRTERLATKLRVSGRDGLRHATNHEEPAPEPPREPLATTQWRRALMPLAVTAGLALAFVAGLLVASRSDDDPDAASAGEPSPAPTATVPITASAQPTQPPRIEVIDGREMEYAGQLVTVALAGNAPVVGTSARERMLAVTLVDNALIRLPFAASGYRGDPRAVSFSLPLRDRAVFLQIMPGEDTGFIVGDRDSAGVFTRSESRQPVVILTASDEEGVFHLQVNTTGELFVSVEPTTTEGIYDEWTGELIRTSDATRVWSVTMLTGGFFFNRCHDGPCDLVISGAEMRAPSLATVSCPEPDVVFLEMASGSMTFTRVRQSDAQDPIVCPSQTVEEGHVFGPVGHYVVTSATSDGRPLSIGAKPDGTVWVGTFRGTVGCPCLTGN
jgi:DNA-binding CsgD family transcriptional regulator